VSKRKSKQGGTGGSYVAEWFGHTVWPPQQVDSSPEAERDQNEQRCPFMSSATAREVSCTKKNPELGAGQATGFCTQSSMSAAGREDWLACPIRVFDKDFSLIRDAVRLLYEVPVSEDFDVFPVPRLGDADVRARVKALTDAAGTGPRLARRIFAFASNPPTLGGEIDLPETNQSPGSKADVSIFEVLGGESDGSPRLGRFVIFEIQTADFHGSPLHAIKNLRKLGPPTIRTAYHEAIADNPGMLSDGVEGPNKANIFKRTITR